MDRSTIVRWVVIAVAVIVFWKWGMPLLSGKGGGDSVQNVPADRYTTAPEFPPDEIDKQTGDLIDPAAPKWGEACKVRGARFEATLSTRGASLTHFKLLDPRYAGSESADMSTTPGVERLRSLRTTFRSDNANDQVKYDQFNWQLERLGDTGCKFTYQDDDVKIVKTIAAGARPFELDVETALTNLSLATKKHRLSIGAFAYRRNEEVKGSLGRQSPFITELSCARGKDVERKGADDFKDGWFAQPLVDRYAAVSNTYFAQAIVPNDGGGDKPECALLSEQMYGLLDGVYVKADDDKAGHVFHAQVQYPARQLEPNQTATYKQIAFFGPKERDVLGAAAGGRGLGDLINLGFFTVVAKVLVGFLIWIHSHVTFGNWGIAIVLMTIFVRTVLFPLTWKSIKSTVAMRRLKPEIDALNAKFKDDAQAKNMAMMQLWRTHKVNPLGGCLPQLVQMPVWFAMYTTLQTAVEMYHTKFLWFTDLSAPDKFYILPLVLGGFMILQQRIVPQQGMDPMQQKMMTWLLPIIFTVMMLFLPAALGVYMLTNSILGIVQQLAVEKFAPRSGPKNDIVVKQGKGDDGDAKQGKGASVALVGKGKARV